MDVTAVDVVIIGGGAQGLIILDTLTEAGYGCALITESDAGGGQTIHSHGFLNTGFGMSGDELPKAAVEIVQPYLRARGVKLTADWTILPPPGFPGFAGLPAANLPAGFAPSFVEAARKLPNQSFDKRQLVEMLIRNREDRIIRGIVTGFQGQDPVQQVRARAHGSNETVALRAKVFVVAAGCGSKRLLQGLVGPTPQLDMIKHRVVHMVCLRAPRGKLPRTSVAAWSLGLLLAAHEDDDSVLWYVTPMEFGGPSFDDAPNDADALPRADMLARATATLQMLYPAVSEVEGLRIGHYAGYRQDIGDGPGTRLCAIVSGAANVIAALPSGLVAPWLNAADTLTLVRSLAEPSGDQPALPDGGNNVRAGSPVEDRAGFTWLTWKDWQQTLPQGSAHA